MLRMSMVRAVIAALALVTAAGTVATTVQAADVGAVAKDTKITTAVKAKLGADHPANLKDISVKTENGTVYLSGTVPTAEQRARAQELAASVKGVNKVVSQIAVKPGS